MITDKLKQTDMTTKQFVYAYVGGAIVMIALQHEMVLNFNSLQWLLYIVFVSLWGFMIYKLLRLFKL